MSTVQLQIQVRKQLEQLLSSIIQVVPSNSGSDPNPDPYRILQREKDLESLDADDLFSEDKDMYAQEETFKKLKYEKDMHGSQFAKTVIVAILFIAIVLVMWNIYKLLQETAAVSASYPKKNSNDHEYYEDEKILGDVEVMSMSINNDSNSNKKQDAEIV